MARKQQKFKRVVAIGDLHCGHRVGLTPPGWQLNPENAWDLKWATIQREQWEWYKRTISGLRPIHLLLVLGDCVDGKSDKADSRDTIRRKRQEQVNMALTCINLAKAAHIEMVYGTRYHVNDWEDDLCTALGDNADIGAHQWPKVTSDNGEDVTFDIKHYIGGSSVPHGRGTAIAKDDLWNLIYADIGKQPRGDFILRGHVHYFEPKKQRGKWLMTCPALQGVGTEFGAERCSGTVDFGLLVFDVYPDGSVDWEERLADLPSHVAKATEY